MTPNALRNAWKSAHLLRDWLETGFSREHPVLVVDEAAARAARDAAASVAASPAASAPAPARDRAIPDQAAGVTDRTGPYQAAGASERTGPDQAAGVSERAAALAALAAEISACSRCGLSVNRTRAVPGEGAIDAPVLFIGEGPGADEDSSGRPFVGAAGQYLDTWLPPIRLERAHCFIANCVKCRPPQNREPHPEELAACLPYLEAQIQAVKPRLICCLGRIAAHTLLGTQASLGELRGRTHQYRGIPVVVTYHPSAVLRDKAGLRKPVWDDLKLLKGLLG
jgi:uracil-DNA glycosylase